MPYKMATSKSHLSFVPDHSLGRTMSISAGALYGSLTYVTVLVFLMQTYVAISSTN